MNDTNRLLRNFLPLGCMLFLGITISCKPRIPSKYIQPGDMESILYDYYLSEEIIRQSGGDTLSQLSFKTNILMNHGVTESQFDESLIYYTRHTEQLHKIYEVLANKFTDEAMSQGASLNEYNRFGQLESSSDTTDIMSGIKTILLFPNASHNSYLIKINTDTTYHKGDRILLDFDTRFIYQDGIRNAIATLAIKFENDSVASRTIQTSSTSHYHMQIEDEQRIGIKEVIACFMLNDNSPSTSVSGLRMMTISGIRLIRMHIKQNKSILQQGKSVVNEIDTLKNQTNDNTLKSDRKSTNFMGISNRVKSIDKRLVPKEIRE